MSGFWRDMRDLLFPGLRHAHAWEYDPDNSMKRWCAGCKEEQWLFSRRASVDEPSLVWQEMGRRDRPFAPIRKGEA